MNARWITGIGLVFMGVISFMAVDPKQLENFTVSRTKKIPVNTVMPEKKPQKVVDEKTPPLPQADLTPQSLASDDNLSQLVGQGFGSSPQGISGLGGTGDFSNSIRQNTSEEKPVTVVERGDVPYPPEARKLGLSGVVVIRAFISESGRVLQTEIETSEPKGIFDQVASTAVKSWRFSPAVREGRAVASWSRQRLRFELN